MKDVCFCDNKGIHSQCTASSLKMQKACQWFDLSSADTRCMYFTEERDNHCDSLSAQKQGLNVPDDIVIEEEISLDESVDKDSERKCCLNCLLFSCSKLTLLNQSSRDQGHGGLTEDNLWDIASDCDDYVDGNTLIFKTKP